MANGVESDCGMGGCGGVVVAMPTPPPTPDVWVRVHSNGSWWRSTVPPMAPNEHPGVLGHRCPECGKSFRTVDGPMSREPLL